MPAKGSKYFQALSTPGPKTGRFYGSTRSLIRDLLSRQKTVSPDNVPGIPKRLAQVALTCMERTGELKIVQPGICGPYGRSATYGKNS